MSWLHIKSKPGVWIAPTDIAVELGRFYRLLDINVEELNFKAMNEIITSFMNIMVSHILREVNDRDTITLFDEYGFLSGDVMQKELGGSDEANDLWYDMQYSAKQLIKTYHFRENTYYKPIISGDTKSFVIFLREDFDIWKFHGMRLNKKKEEEKEIEEVGKEADEAEMELLKEQIKMLRDKVEVLEFDKQQLTFRLNQEVLNVHNTNRYPK